MSYLTKSVLKLPRTDNYAFVWFHDEKSYLKAIRDDMRLFGVCINYMTCPIYDSKLSNTLLIEIKTKLKMNEITKRIQSILCDYELRYSLKYEDNYPIFITLEFPSHNEAWSAYYLFQIKYLSKGSYHIPFRPLWRKNLYYRVMIEKEKSIQLRLFNMATKTSDHDDHDRKYDDMNDWNQHETI
jgi:hypothetical protein